MSLEPLEHESQQTQEERDLAAHVRTKVEEARSSSNRIAHEGIWMTNIAYLVGYNNIQYNTTSRRFEPINRVSPYPGRQALTVNKILSTCQNRLARLCKNPPKYDVRPESNAQEDKDAARLSLQILMSMWEKLKLDEKQAAIKMWLQQCGHSYIKICWDDQLGNPVLDPETGGIVYEGDVRADVVSAFEIFPDPLAKSWEEAKRSWVIHAKVRKLDYFKTQYPERGHLVKQEDAWLLSAQYEQRINSMNTRGPSTSGIVESFKDSAVELVKYEARSQKYPNGRMIVTAAGILLRNDPLPVGEIPFEKFDDILVAGKYYSEAIITHLRPIQDAYNETVRRRNDWTRKLLAGKYAAARGSNLSQEALNDQSGEVVYYDPIPNAPDGGRPSKIDLPVIPQYAYVEEERLNAMFNDISGIAEVDKGNLPSASIPAIGMQLLTEQTDTRIGVMTSQHEYSFAGAGSLILKYVQKYYKTPRKLKLGGKVGQYEVKEVTGEMIRGNTDVQVIRGSTLPGSKVLRRQEIINTFQQGLLGDPADPKVREKVLDMLEFGDIAEMWTDISIDDDQIKRGISLIERGIPPEVEELDNHEMWILKLNRYRKSEKFELLSPEAQEALMLTLEKHLQFLIEISSPPPAPIPPLPTEMAAPAEPLPQEGNV